MVSADQDVSGNPPNTEEQFQFIPARRYSEKDPDPSGTRFELANGSGFGIWIQLSPND